MYAKLSYLNFSSSFNLVDSSLHSFYTTYEVGGVYPLQLVIYIFFE